MARLPVPALSGENQREIRAAVPLHPGGLLPRRTFRNLDDLNVQLADWLDLVANVRVHGTTQRVVAEAFAAEQPELQALPDHRFDAAVKLERRVSHDGMVCVGGNYYSVPDRIRRVVESSNCPITSGLSTC